MKSTAKKLSITLLAAATAFTPLVSVAHAGGDSDAWQRETNGSYKHKSWKHHNYRGHGKQRHVYRGHSNKDAVALGIIGLGVGAIIGGAIANSHNSPRVIHRPVPNVRHYGQPRVVNGGGSFEPWTKSWFRYCSNKYRSFNASTGTYRGYDGRDHFCVAR
ncbi:BA14K family protein [Hoeflea sp.]|uniref:BA14K family protein n=1 Tax=Hoeflea sp. TaxID=1940281 RepID=UPI0037495C5A